MNKAEEKNTVLTPIKVEENQRRKIYKPGDLFGDLTLITCKKWRHANVRALEDSSVLVFNNAYINKIIKVDYDKYKVGIEFKGRISRTVSILNIDIS